MITHGIPRRPIRWPLLLLAAAAVTACGGASEADAHGTFEADEVTVSAEASGRLVRFTAEEGRRLPVGERVAVVDTTDAVLGLREIRARRQAADARRTRAAREVEVVQAELEAAREELTRDRRLHRDSAATDRQLNLRRREVRVLERRLEATRAQLDAARQEASSLEARAEQGRERLRDSYVENPVEGRVLQTFVDEGEHVVAGQPLYDVAALDTLRLTAYVTGGQLSRVRLGQVVTVRYDAGPDRTEDRSGRVVRIADEAEFTPTPVLTREERVNFVYEVEVTVPNEDGALKIGMPGELHLPEEPSGGSSPSEDGADRPGDDRRGAGA
jgi:HlyD family secretion protein